MIVCSALLATNLEISHQTATGGSRHGGRLLLRNMSREMRSKFSVSHGGVDSRVVCGRVEVAQRSVYVSSRVDGRGVVRFMYEGSDAVEWQMQGPAFACRGEEMAERGNLESEDPIISGSADRSEVSSQRVTRFIQVLYRR